MILFQQFKFFHLSSRLWILSELIYGKVDGLCIHLTGYLAAYLTPLHAQFLITDLVLDMIHQTSKKTIIYLISDVIFKSSVVFDLIWLIFLHLIHILNVRLEIHFWKLHKYASILKDFKKLIRQYFFPFKWGLKYKTGILFFHLFQVVLETEITNKAALRLYENLGFIRDKRLFRYYLNGVDALRLKLWLR